MRVQVQQPDVLELVVDHHLTAVRRDAQGRLETGRRQLDRGLARAVHGLRVDVEVALALRGKEHARAIPRPLRQHVLTEAIGEPRQRQPLQVRDPDVAVPAGDPVHRHVRSVRRQARVGVDDRP